MFPRLLLPALFVGLAIFSPWLFQDWLNGRTGNGESKLYTAVSTFPDRFREKFDSSFSLASISEMAPEIERKNPDQTGLSHPPYPVASKTKKLLQGLVPTSFLPSSEELVSPIDIPTSVRVDAIKDRTLERIEGDLSLVGLKAGDPVFVRIFKEEEELELWMKGSGESHYTLFKVYRIRHWSGTLGPKLRDGDGQGPEGFYHVSSFRFRPDTRHHLGMDLGYPNEFDEYHGRTGGDIMIHGGTSSAGSYALAPGEMEEIYVLASAALEHGQRFFRVNAFPFRMTDKRMEQEWKRQPRWIEFWTNLKEGYDFFENVNVPPDVRVDAGDYEFSLH